MSTQLFLPHLTTVAVTGGNGFIASEIVAQLLSRGYKVNATVRDPHDEEKVGYLKTFLNSHNLRLFKATLDDSHSFDEVFRDCQVILHTASPIVTDPNADPEHAYVTVAVEGTKNVFDAIARSGHSVKTVILTSSVVAVSSNGGLIPETHVFTEKDWSPADRLRELKRWYPLSKTLAEQAAWNHDIVTSKKVKMVVINPGWVIGRVTNKKHVAGTPGKWLSALQGQWKTIPNRGTLPVDVYDVARTHIRAFEDPDAEGRYCCVFGTVHHKEVVDALNRTGKWEKLPSVLDEAPYSQGVDLFNCRKCEILIGGFRSLDQTCYDMAHSYKALGLI